VGEGNRKTEMESELWMYRRMTSWPQSLRPHRMRVTCIYTGLPTTRDLVELCKWTFIMVALASCMGFGLHFGRSGSEANFDWERRA